jgi:Tfp pilus assembly protein PilO
VAETFAFLEDLGRLAREERVRLNLVNPGALNPAGDVACFPVKLSVKGSFPHLVRFLTLVENSPRLVRAERISFTESSRGADIELEATLLVFCTPEGIETAEEASL